METTTSRRSVLRRALTGGVVTIGSAVVPVAGLFRPAAAQEGDEVPTEEELAAFAEAVELAAAAAYDQAGGKLTGPVQQAAAGAAGHHREHAARFAAASGGKATGQPNPQLMQVLSDQVRDAKSPEAAGQVLYDLESSLAGTHLYALGVAKSASALQLAASVLPVESAHAAALAMAIGLPVATKADTPSAPAAVPSFETEDKRLDPTVFTEQEEGA